MNVRDLVYAFVSVVCVCVRLGVCLWKKKVGSFEFQLMAVF